MLTRKMNETKIQKVRNSFMVQVQQYYATMGIIIDMHETYAPRLAEHSNMFNDGSIQTEKHALNLAVELAAIWGVTFQA